jgi:hypothetical protein
MKKRRGVRFPARLSLSLDLFFDFIVTSLWQTPASNQMINACSKQEDAKA